MESLGIFRKWSVDRAGATAPIFALCIGALLSIVATALALAIDSNAASDAQETADQAAIAGATAFITSSAAKADTRSDLAEEQAKLFATSNSEYALVDLQVDTVTEDAYGQQTKIHVELEFQPVNIAARWMGRSGTAAIRRKATAEAVWGFPLCALSLADDGNGIRTADDVNLKAENCIIWSNSPDSASMNFTGGKVSAKEFCAAGGVSGASRAKPSPEEKCEIIPDPLVDWRPPQPGSCETVSEDLASVTSEEFERMLAFISGTVSFVQSRSSDGNLSNPDSLRSTAQTITGGLVDKGSFLVDENGQFTLGPGEGYTLEELLQLAGLLDNLDPDIYEDDIYYDTPTQTLKPGTYCGLDIAQGHVLMEPGTYIIRDAPLTVRRRATLTGEGVTIVLWGEGTNFGVLDQARLTLRAPETGDTAGFALVEDASQSLSEPLPPRSRLTGSGVIDAIGTIYLPRHDFAITGNGAGKQASPLLQIVANRLMMSDEGELNIKFDTSKTKVPVGIKPERTARLIE